MSQVVEVYTNLLDNVRGRIYRLTTEKASLQAAATRLTEIDTELADLNATVSDVAAKFKELTADDRPVAEIAVQGSFRPSVEPMIAPPVEASSGG